MIKILGRIFLRSESVSGPNLAFGPESRITVFHKFFEQFQKWKNHQMTMMTMVSHRENFYYFSPFFHLLVWINGTVTITTFRYQKICWCKDVSKFFYEYSNKPQKLRLFCRVCWEKYSFILRITKPFNFYPRLLLSLPTLLAMLVAKNLSKIKFPAQHLQSEIWNVMKRLLSFWNQFRHQNLDSWQHQDSL